MYELAVPRTSLHNDGFVTSHLPVDVRLANVHCAPRRHRSLRGQHGSGAKTNSTLCSKREEQTALTTQSHRVTTHTIGTQYRVGYKHRVCPLMTNSTVAFGIDADHEPRLVHEVDHR